MKYRREIDGLRALAVIPVILFHAGFTQMSGGYVGVDVFFVISGFLITGILVRELNSGQFSLLGFYERRARRILPALFFVILFTSFIAVIVMLPYELEALGRGITAVIFFVSNVLFWSESGYFAAASELNPLLHTWSLAVEEQFYILFPLALWAGWRWFPKWTVSLLVLVTLGSLSLAEFLSTRIPSANFFLLPTRAWELLAGSLTALFLLRRGAPQGALAEALGATGLAAIVISIFTYDSATPFPSLYSLVPVLGSVAIIVAASPVTLVGKLLGTAPFVGVGLISYSAYLWHQPLFAYARLLDADQHPEQAVMLSLALLTLVLSWLTWWFVERPFRRRDAFSQSRIFGLSGLVSVGFLVLAASAIATGGLPHRYPEEKRDLVMIGPLEYKGFVTGAYTGVRDAPLSDKKPNLVLVGDSFSQDFYNVIRAAGAFKEYAISAIYVPARCQVHFGISQDLLISHLDPNDRIRCQRSGLSDASVAKMRAADVVIIAARWKPWSAAALGKTLRVMALPGKVFVIGSKSFEKNRRSLLVFDPEQYDAARKAPEAWVHETSTLLEQTLPKGQFINLVARICIDGCPLFTGDGALISYDGVHLTPEGAAHIANLVFDRGPLALFARHSTAPAGHADALRVPLANWQEAAGPVMVKAKNDPSR